MARAIHKHVAVRGERGGQSGRSRTLGGTQQDGSSLTQILDQRLNEERVEFGDHGAVLGVGFVLYNHREKYIGIIREKYRYQREKA
jgi:hypothetical protein